MVYLQIVICSLLCLFCFILVILSFISLFHDLNQ